MAAKLGLSRGMRLLATCDLKNRPDSLQVMLHQGHAFVSHPFTGGFSVLDIRDPRKPEPVTYVPPPPGTRTLHLQLSDGILLVTNEADNSASEKYLDKAQYFGQQLGQDTGGLEEFSAGVRVYDVSDPARPRAAGFLPIPGFGTHRLWWDGGPLATASSMPLGYDDFILSVLDMKDPLKPELIGHWAPDAQPARGRMGLHHAILDGTLAYGAWRAGGLQIVDTQGGQLTYVGGLTPGAWGGGNTHTTLPLPGRNLVVLADESVQDHQADGLRKIWLLDVADRGQPTILSALPEPAALDFRAMDGVFGPHNLHENRPGTWRSEELIFATYQNAGVRAYDISEPEAPREVAFCVPPPPARNVDPRAGGALVPQSADLVVSPEGLIVASDLNAGISLIQYETSKP
ncbi:MAG TPA: hypothetical protein VFQ68_14365 [Streptosporangiaceae bacterium]|nr:hypothetical protein [Streptosporangiaceae bacterium]